MSVDSKIPLKLNELVETLSKAPNSGGAPVHLWDPPFCGDIDLTIKKDGSWTYMGTPITRQKLVKLFASVLKHEDDGKYYLVTPVEKIGITVEDLPFMAISMEVKGEAEEQIISFETNMQNSVIAGKEHDLSFTEEGDTAEIKPSIIIRANLKARLTRSLYYQLTDLAVPHKINDREYLGVWSAGEFFPMAERDECID